MFDFYHILISLHLFITAIAGLMMAADSIARQHRGLNKPIRQIEGRWHKRPGAGKYPTGFT